MILKYDIPLNHFSLVKLLANILNLCTLIGMSAISFFDFGVMFWPKVRKIACYLTQQPGATFPEKLEFE